MESKLLRGVRPLYRQVYDYLIDQIAAGAWKPGTALPSEPELGRQLGVSQGTVRKALDELTSNGVMERHQGKGTFVAANTEERSLFRFFRLCTLDGNRAVPSAAGEKVKRRTATPADAARLGIGRNVKVIEIKRVRLIAQAPVVFETIVVPAALFAGLEAHKTLPNSVYSMYHSLYGINIVSVREELRSVRANAEDRERLGVPTGAPLLHIDRVALGIDGTKVEWRISRFSTVDFFYSIELA